MAYTLGNKCAKNLCKWVVLLQLIIENVVTCFFLEHSVVFNNMHTHSYTLGCTYVKHQNVHANCKLDYYVSHRFGCG